MDTFAFLLLLLLLSLPLLLLAAICSHLLRRYELIHDWPHIPAARRNTCALLCALYTVLSLPLLWWIYELLSFPLASAEAELAFAVFYALALLFSTLSWLLMVSALERTMPPGNRRPAARLAFRLQASLIYLLALVATVLYSFDAIGG